MYSVSVKDASFDPSGQEIVSVIFFAPGCSSFSVAASFAPWVEPLALPPARSDENPPKS